MGSATSKDNQRNPQHRTRSKTNSNSQTAGSRRTVPRRKVARCRPNHHPNPALDPSTDYPQSSTDSGHGTCFSDTDCCSSTASSDFCAICRDLDLADSGDQVASPQPDSSSKSVQFRPNRMQENHLQVISEQASVYSDPTSSDQGFVEDLPIEVTSYKDWLFPHLNKMKEIARDISEELTDFSFKVESVFRAQQDFISFIVKRNKIEPSNISLYLKPTSDKIAEIEDIRNTRRQSEHFNHFSTVSESLPVLGWVTLTSEVTDFVAEMKNCGKFYSNRVLQQWKGKDQKHCQWVSEWMELLDMLEKYVKQFFPHGVTSRAGKTLRKSETYEMLKSDHDVSNLVDKHGIVLDRSKLGPGKDLIISNCSNSSFVIPVICRNICIDHCINITVTITQLEDTLKITGCSSAKILMDGKVPKIEVDNTTGAVFQLSNESLNTEILSSCSSRVVLLMGGEGGKEIKIPCKLRTIVEGQEKVNTVVVEE